MKPDRPYFLWDVDVSKVELRERLRTPDPDARAQWQACVLREARFLEGAAAACGASTNKMWSHQRAGRSAHKMRPERTA
jgi:hypothetical protein